jgi:hypothetical protein
MWHYNLGRNKRKYKGTAYSKNGDKINHRYKKNMSPVERKSKKIEFFLGEFTICFRSSVLCREV